MLAKGSTLAILCTISSIVSACSTERVSKNAQRGSTNPGTASGTPAPSVSTPPIQGGQCTPSLVEANTRLAFASQPAAVWEYKNRVGTNQLPDFVVRGFKRDNETCLLIPHYELGLICGTTLQSLSAVAQRVYDSPEDPLFPNYNYHNWIVSPYALADGSVFGLAHSEWYQCLQFPSDASRKCSVQSNRVNSWSNALSGFLSNNGGRSWAKISTIQRPEVLSDTFPNLWTQSMLHFGFFHPGNIIQEKNFFYAFATHVGRNMTSGAVADSGLVLLRTNDLRSPDWQQVVPGATAVSKPYDAMILPGTTNANHAHFDFATVTYNTSLCKYLLMFWDNATEKLRYTTFESLENPVFGAFRDVANQEVLAVPFNQSGVGFIRQNYPTGQFDPDSLGNNFEYTDSEFYMFANSFDPSNGLNRNLYRTKVRLVDASSIPGIRVDEQDAELSNVYRSTNGLDHLYSRDAAEGSQSGWSSEGVAFRLYSQNAEGRRALFRCINKGAPEHFLSTDSACEGVGLHEGLLGYLSTAQTPGSAPLIRCYGKTTLLHVSTRNAAECPAATTTTEGIQGYAM
jgi:hypothetical protein